MSDLNLAINIGAVDSASGVIRAVGKAVSDLASGNIAGAALIAGAAVVGIGAASVTMAADFQQSLLKIQAYAGLTKQQTDAMSQSLLAMAPAVGVGPKELADALYPIVSSGYNAADALNILKLSAETASASGAKTSVVADALTTSLGAMHAPASEAGHYMDMLNKIVSIGKGEVPDYAAVIGKLSLAASGAGVDFATAGAALADLTTHGFPSVAQASTSLGNLFTQIGVKTDALAQHAKKAGIAFDAHKFATLSLADKLDYLQKITGGNQGELLKLVGGSTVALKAFNALEGGTKDLHANLDAMKNSAGATDAVFKTASSGFNASMNRAKAASDVLMIQFGNYLIPIINQVGSTVLDLVTKFTTWITTSGVIPGTINAISTAIRGGQQAIQNIIVWWNTWKPQIESVALALTVFFLPAIIKAGAEAVIAGVKLTVNFIASMYKAGIEAVVSGGKIAINFVGSVIQAGMEGWQSVGKLMSFVGSIIISGTQSAIAGIKIGVNYVGALIASGYESAIAGIKIGVNFVGALIASGYESAVAGIKIGVNFVGALIAAGAQSALAGLKIAGSFIASLISAGIEAVIAGATMMASLVPALIATAVAALAAAWPFLLIAAIVAVVVVAVVLAIQHWGAISAWLQGVWQAFSAWFMSALQAIGAFFVNIWNGIKGFLQAAWNFIVTAAKIAAMVLFVVITGPIGLLILYIITHWTQVSAWLQAAWNALRNFATNMWNAIVNAIRTAWNTVIGVLTSVWNTIVSWFSGLPAQALQFGINIIQGFINGIKSMLGAVGNAAASVVNTVKNFLGFHSPTKEGPGRELDEWPRNMVASYAKGLASGLPQIQSAVQLLVKPLAVLGSPSASGASADTPVSTQGGAPVYNVTINAPALSKREADQLGQNFVDYLSRKTRQSGNMVTWTSGGKN